MTKFTRLGVSGREDKVVLEIKSLSELLDCPLKIPEYQRIYCWTEKNVLQLLGDIQDIKDEYRLGTIILQKKDPVHDIIDGQQRLVTLSLILKELKYTGKNPLLEEKFENEEACEYVAYNKFVINNYLKRFENHFDCEKLLEFLTFNVLTLNDSSLDLAYTFFSNENSRGCPLSDFDLLKAHHLRYVDDESQAKHVSNIWDNMLLKEQPKENKLEKNYERTLGLYIFRLRKWLNLDDWDENEKFKVKNEYEAAKTIPEIPPFGEQFQFKEPIQGGSHFFAYVSTFIGRFDRFSETHQYKCLHETLVGETHGWFRDVIEAFLFGYYLKFGTEYLSEALALTTRIVSQARYDNSRIYKETIFDCAKNSKIIISIDRSTSPTFFLAEMKDKVKLLVKPEKLTPIQKRYEGIVKSLFEKLKDSFLVKFSEGVL